MRRPRRAPPQWTPVRSINSAAKGLAYPSSNVSASCSTRASKWTPRSARAPSFASFSLEVTALLKTSSCALLAHPRNHQSRACRWQALFLFDQASSGLARQALWRDWSDDSRFPVATSENPGIGEGEGTSGPGRATVFRNCEHFDRLLTSSYFGAPSGHTDDHLVHSLVKRCATRGEEVRPITSNVAAFDP